jgi:hypothetical protein
MESIGHVASVDGDVVASGVVAAISGALFIKNLIDLLVGLETLDLARRLGAF